MDKVSENMKTNTIETTIGDLVYAIAEAAEEATIDEKDLSKITQLILHDILERRKD